MQPDIIITNEIFSSLQEDSWILPGLVSLDLAEVVCLGQSFFFVCECNVNLGTSLWSLGILLCSSPSKLD